MRPARATPNPQAKKATNITLPMDVYQAAKSLGLNISQLCEHACAKRSNCARSSNGTKTTPLSSRHITSGWRRRV